MSEKKLPIGKSSLVEAFENLMNNPKEILKLLTTLNKFSEKPWEKADLEKHYRKVAFVILSKVFILEIHIWPYKCN